MGQPVLHQSLDKMKECVEFMNREEVDFLVELGDFVNGAEEETLGHLHEIENLYSTFRGPRYHVLGNHDLDSLSKMQFQSVISNTGLEESATWYSFDREVSMWWCWMQILRPMVTTMIPETSTGPMRIYQRNSWIG
ncbi:MAG: metallophosphoesterase [Balneolaceae bacterium]|nr:metallophosphoesterase [Balneolaceae bacterium]